ncbi:hypothetical protein ONZ45_g1900 [Pleurotus djamor]|nr:hypothetical protein ONZ45_g1900 [Pleurotus djamor]
MISHPALTTASSPIYLLERSWVLYALRSSTWKRLDVLGPFSNADVNQRIWTTPTWNTRLYDWCSSSFPTTYASNIKELTIPRTTKALSCPISASPSTPYTKLKLLGTGLMLGLVG